MECLVTKLKGCVNDNDILKLGEIRVLKQKVDTWHPIAHGFTLSFAEDTELSIIGDGYFTDLTGVENNDKTLRITKNIPTNVCYSNSDIAISIPNKYELTQFNLCYPSGVSGDTSYNGNDSKNILGGLSALKYCKKLTMLDLRYTGVEGDIASIAILPLNNIRLAGLEGVVGDIKCLENKELLAVDFEATSVVGDIGVLNTINGVTYISFNSVKGVYGSITDIGNSDTLTSIDINSANNIDGDISAFNEYTKLETLIVANTKVSGSINNIKAPLETLNLWQTDVTGTIENFVATQRAAGRTSGSCKNGGFGYGKVTFKGEAISFGDDTLIWTPTQITCKGDTITA